MKIVVDLLGAPARSGGMRSYAQELIHAWVGEYSEDRLILVGGSWIAQEFEFYPSIKTVCVSGETTLTRVLSQFFRSPWVYFSNRADVLLSVSPVVSPLVPRSRRACVVHDWRHLKNAKEFGRIQRLYRRIWQTSVNRAGFVVAISGKTAQETLSYAPEANVCVVENGRDHSRRWQTVRRNQGHATILTFGHHSNKRPELVIAALGLLRDKVPEQTQLVVLGANAAYAEALREVARLNHVDEQCRFPGFVSDIEYQRLIQSSSVVVLASSDEGFGLPVAEAQYFGIPVVGTADSGLSIIHGLGLIVADPSAESLAGKIFEGLDLGINRSGGREPMNTWADTARGIRALARAVTQRVVPGALKSGATK